MERPVIIYDGDCGFCRRQIERIARWSQPGTFEYLPWQAPEAAERFPQLTNASLESGLRIITADGRTYVAGDALHQVARRMPGVRWIAWLYELPGLGQLARFGYRLVAKNRHRFSGCGDDGEACPPSNG